MSEMKRAFRSPDLTSFFYRWEREVQEGKGWGRGCADHEGWYGSPDLSFPLSALCAEASREPKVQERPSSSCHSRLGLHVSLG